MRADVASVIMINRNGGEYLRRALRTLRADLEAVSRTLPRFELLVVDNGSTDRSLEIIETELAGAGFAWRVVREPVPGVNSARNAGIRESRGDLLIYVDSDLTFQPGWLAAYLDAAASYPDCEIFAGRVRVGEVEGDAPPWLDLEGLYGRPAIVVRLDLGDKLKVLPLGGLGPVGPNMAFRHSVFERLGPFDMRFGLRPGSLVPGAEAEYFDRLARAGLDFVYVPDAMVFHPLRRNQISRSYFLRRMHGIGRVTARLNRIRGVSCRRVLGMTLFAYEYLLRAALSYGASLFTFDPKRRFYWRCEIEKILGFLHEDFEEYRHPEPKPALSPPGRALELPRS